MLHPRTSSASWTTHFTLISQAIGVCVVNGVPAPSEMQDFRFVSEFRFFRVLFRLISVFFLHNLDIKHVISDSFQCSHLHHCTLIPELFFFKFSGVSSLRGQLLDYLFPPFCLIPLYSPFKIWHTIWCAMAISKL